MTRVTGFEFEIPHVNNKDTVFTCRLPMSYKNKTRYEQLSAAAMIAVKNKESLKNANLSLVHFNELSIDGSFDNANLNGATFKHCLLYNTATFAGANMRNIEILNSDLYSGNFSEAHLFNLKIKRSRINNFDFSNTTGNFSVAFVDCTLINIKLKLEFYDAVRIKYCAIDDSGNLFNGGIRSDDYQFWGYVKNGQLMIRAGCRHFTLAEARKHWIKTRRDTKLGAESLLLVDHIKAQFNLSKMKWDN